MTALFFVGGPDITASPSVRHLWNLGHIAFFFSATIAWLHFFPVHSKTQFFVLISAILILSFFIEVIQRMIGRDFSTMDVLRNLTGAVFGALVVSTRQVHITLISFFSLILLLDVGGFAFKAHNDIQLQRQAPILDNFENFATLSYWNSDIDYATHPVTEGQFSAQADLTPQLYSGVFMSPVMRDWTGYSALQVMIYSPLDLIEPLTIRINDRQHELSQQAHNDRFNQQFSLHSGWNRIEIPLADIEHSPSGRKMNMRQVYKLGVFVSNLQEPITLYLDDLRLVH